VIESGQAEFMTMDHVIDDHVCLEPSPGHTPGHVYVRIRSGGAARAGYFLNGTRTGPCW
jgi:glyoxylase-like metal-dependent hydrolase (beta-lactamase superfamily II)